ncbi:hypothetical protein HK100_000076 [Physocladia obscura]|uniref:Uncharacterized protein n=1 Tax=Physocladia obscura TaxID=109957 RepID=A0AAD5XFV3_9FUNG|nr:hypothetical protein HK100_000076 [Physocladia obscura]
MKTIEDTSDKLIYRVRPHLSLIARFLVIATFYEDSLRLVSGNKRRSISASKHDSNDNIVDTSSYEKGNNARSNDVDRGRGGTVTRIRDPAGCVLRVPHAQRLRGLDDVSSGGGCPRSTTARQCRVPAAALP